MNKEELKNKMENLNEKMKDVGAKIKDATDTVILTGMEAKDTLDEKVEDAKSNLESAKEQCRR